MIKRFNKIRRLLKMIDDHAHYLFAIAGLLFVITSCTEYPKDTYQTFEEVKNGTLLVGYTINPPWVFETENGLDGIEVHIIKDFAKTINANINWIKKNEQSLLDDLQHRNLHLVISGLTTTSPWRKRVGMTKSYIWHGSQKYTLAVPPGEIRFLFEIEKFLDNYKKEIKELYHQNLK